MTILHCYRLASQQHGCPVQSRLNKYFLTSLKAKYFPGRGSGTEGGVEIEDQDIDNTECRVEWELGT